MPQKSSAPGRSSKIRVPKPEPIRKKARTRNTGDNITILWPCSNYETGECELQFTGTFFKNKNGEPCPSPKRKCSKCGQYWDLPHYLRYARTGFIEVQGRSQEYMLLFDDSMCPDCGPPRDDLPIFVDKSRKLRLRIKQLTSENGEPYRWWDQEPGEFTKGGRLKGKWLSMERARIRWMNGPHKFSHKMGKWVRGKNGAGNIFRLQPRDNLSKSPDTGRRYGKRARKP